MPRYYTAEQMGPTCPVCYLRVPLAIATNVHPCCAGGDE